MHCPTLVDLPSPPPGKSGWPWTEETPQLPETMPDGRPWPKISVVTPSYNQGHFLEETIRSVLLQGYPDVEYFVLDGGSTDGSREIIEKYSAWLSYWTSESDKGQCDAINKGFARASGVLLAWLNSDDTYHPGALADAASTYVAHPEAALIYGLCHVVDVDGRPMKAKGEPWDLGKLFSQNYSFIGQPATFMNAEVFRQAGPLDVSLHNALDWELWIRLGLISGGVFVREPWATSRLWADCKSVKHAANALLEHRRVLHRFLSDRSISREIRGEMQRGLARLEWRAGEQSIREKSWPQVPAHFATALRLSPSYTLSTLLYDTAVAVLPARLQRAGVHFKRILT